jgi:outer membrane protein assembly factor BamB
VPVAVAVTALAAAPAWAQGAASWPQFQGGPDHPASVADGVAPPYREAWRFDPGLTGRFGVSAPVIEGDVAVTVAPRAVYAVDLTTGEQAWELPRAYGPTSMPAIATAGDAPALIYTEGYGSNPPDEAFPSASPGASASPSTTSSPSPGASEGGEGSVDSHVVAVDMETHTPIWDTPVQLDAVTRTGVTIDGDTAYVGDEGATVTAIDTATGEVRWTYDAPGPVSTTIAAGEGTVVLSTQPRPSRPAFVVALHAEDGSEAWRFQPTTLPFITTVPTIADGVVYVGIGTQSGATAYALTMEEGGERWATAVNSSFTPFVSLVPAGDEVLAVDAFGQAYAFDATTGDRRWNFALNAVSVRTVPVLSGTALLVTTVRGSLVAIDVDRNELVARTWAQGPQGYLGAMAVTSDLVVAVKGGHHPGLVAFEHDPDAALLAEPSPTVLVVGTMVANFAVAAIPLLLILGLGGRWLIGRMGPAFADDGPDEMDLEDDTDADTDAEDDDAEDDDAEDDDA